MKKTEIRLNMKDRYNIKRGNIIIHLYMGEYEFMSNQEIYDYNISSTSFIRCLHTDVDQWVSEHIDNQPDMKRKGVIVNNLSHNDVFYSDHLVYDRSLDALLPVIDKLSREYYHHLDMMDTIKSLLKGGYGNSLVFSVENLWLRVIEVIKIINGYEDCEIYKSKQ